MAKDPLTVEAILGVLETTPDRLASATAGVAAISLRTRPEPDEWSAVEVLAHLRSCADVWGEYIADITQRGVTTIHTVNPTTWAQQTDYDQLEFAPSLRAFNEQRSTLLALLHTFTAEDWGRTVTVTGAGAPLTKSVLSYGDRMARHERPHVKQIERAVASGRARSGDR